MKQPSAVFDDQCDPAFLHRSFPLLSAEGIANLGTRKVAIAGCGGVGAGVALTLARMGVGQYHLSDPGRFDVPDINRQWGATHRTVGKLKTEVYEGMLRDINPAAEIRTFSSGCTMDNCAEFLDGCHVLIDCLDVSVAHELREKVHAEARARNMFAAVGPMLGFGCAVVCSSPDGMDMKTWTDTFKRTKSSAEFPEILKKIYMPEHLDLIGKCVALGRVPSLAVAPTLAVSLIATECVLHLLDGIVPGSRKPVVLPRIMFFDLFRMSYYILDAGMVLEKETK